MKSWPRSGGAPHGPRHPPLINPPTSPPPRYLMACSTVRMQRMGESDTRTGARYSHHALALRALRNPRMATCMYILRCCPHTINIFRKTWSPPRSLTISNVLDPSACHSSTHSDVALACGPYILNTFTIHAPTAIIIFFTSWSPP